MNRKAHVCHLVDIIPPYEDEREHDMYTIVVSSCGHEELVEHNTAKARLKAELGRLQNEIINCDDKQWAEIEELARTRTRLNEKYRNFIGWLGAVD